MAREGLSRGDLLLLGAVLSAAGAGVSAYLTWEKYSAANLQVCDLNPWINCSVVQNSVYSSVFGIPTAAVGLAGFLILFGFLVLGFRGRERLGPWPLDAWTLLFASLGALAGLALSFIEVFVIKAICLFCVTGFALDLGVLALALVLRRRSATPGAP